jgi:7,8-dihydropterin-6-yl-methyl-4-(beta-D-ribofuranosyl)aminobenzene 5'-phosphate synthase
MVEFQNRAALWQVLQLAARKLAITLLRSLPLAFISVGAVVGQMNASHQVHALKITVLVTNVAGNPFEGEGEWGYSALVEVDSHKILYDTGASADMVLKNAAALHIDLSGVGGCDPVA